MNCKPGDLALIVAPTVLQNLGALVEVVELARNGRWWVRSLSGPRLGDDGNYHGVAQVPDSGLRPIRGAPVPKEACQREAEAVLEC